MIIICLSIFLCRLIDVSIGTIKTMYIVKGNKIVSSILSFFEIIIWLFASRTALTSNTVNIYILISYALGYTTGTLLGIIINEKFIKSIYMLEIVSNKIDYDEIKNNKYGITKINNNTYHICATKKKYKELLDILQKMDNKAFIIVTESKIIHNGFIK